LVLSGFATPTGPCMRPTEQRSLRTAATLTHGRERRPTPSSHRAALSSEPSHSRSEPDALRAAADASHIVTRNADSAIRSRALLGSWLHSVTCPGRRQTRALPPIWRCSKCRRDVAESRADRDVRRAEASGRVPHSRRSGRCPRSESGGRKSDLAALPVRRLGRAAGPPVVRGREPDAGAGAAVEEGRHRRGESGSWLTTAPGGRPRLRPGAWSGRHRQRRTGRRAELPASPRLASHQRR
jgi:hypothetical protein